MFPQNAGKYFFSYPRGIIYNNYFFSSKRRKNSIKVLSKLKKNCPKGEEEFSKSEKSLSKTSKYLPFIGEQIK
jgi:hypothetical protein